MATVKEEICSVKNWKESFWETALCSVNSSHRVTAFPSRCLSLRLFLWNLQRDIWKPIKGYGEKGNLLLKTGKKLSEKLLCVLLIHLKELQLSLKTPFAKTVLVEFAKWYLEAHRGLWWKRKYLQWKTRKKLSDTLLCVLLIHLSIVQLSAQEAFR